jgi:hypothetical protein
MDDLVFPHLMMLALVMVYFWSVTLGVFLLVMPLRRRRIAQFELAYSRQHSTMAYQRGSIVFTAETQEVPALQVYDPPRPRLRHINPSEQVSLAITPDDAAANAPQPESNLQRLIHHLTKSKMTATVPTVTTSSTD